MSPQGVIVPWLPAMGLLILASAFFSGSEAAYFSLRPGDRRNFAESNHVNRLVVRLLQSPEQLLSTILLWNLLINMAYFAIASIVATRLEEIDCSGLAVIFSIASLFAIIFFSEMFPKSVAVRNAVAISRLATRPLDIAIRSVSPILPMLSLANRVSMRILWPGLEAEQDLDIDDIDRAIRLTAPDERLADRERELLRKLISLAKVRVDEWMRPRSQYQIFPSHEAMTADIAIQESYIFVGDADSGNIDSVVSTQWLRPSHLDDLEAASEPPIVVPWSTSVATVFDALRSEKRVVASVVNEYGETIGAISIDDILLALMTRESNVGASVEDGSQHQVERWVVPGSMSARELAVRLNVDPPHGSNVTVAGLMQTLRRRIPRLNDRCFWNGHLLEVVCESDDGSLEIEVSSMSESGDFEL